MTSTVNPCIPLHQVSDAADNHPECVTGGTWGQRVVNDDKSDKRRKHHEFAICCPIFVMLGVIVGAIVFFALMPHVVEETTIDSQAMRHGLGYRFNKTLAKAFVVAMPIAKPASPAALAAPASFSSGPHRPPDSKGPTATAMPHLWGSLEAFRKTSQSRRGRAPVANFDGENLSHIPRFERIKALSVSNPFYTNLKLGVTIFLVGFPSFGLCIVFLYALMGRHIARKPVDGATLGQNAGLASTAQHQVPTRHKSVIMQAPIAVEKDARPLHLKIDGRWYDVTAWADKHPGGRYVLEWAHGFDVTGAFHTIHLFSAKKSAQILSRLPEADLTECERREQVLPPIVRAPMEEQQPTGMDRFMLGGEKFVQLLSPPTSELPENVPVVPASGLPWQQHQEDAEQKQQQMQMAFSADAGAVGVVGESALKRDLEEMLQRHFASPMEYKATTEHWIRILGALALWAACLVGWVYGSLPATLLLPFAQWALFSPTVHEASHSTLSTIPWVNKAAAFCGLHFIYNPYIWWPQHIISHHQYTNDDALDVDLHHLRPARLHPGCEVDEGYSGANFIFKGFFSTMGMSILWPIRNLQRKATGRWYENLVTPKPEAVSDKEFMISLVPVAFVLVWPWVRVLAGEINVLEAFFQWYYPWAVTGAIWTVMTQVSHVQEDCQRPPTGSPDDYFRWQIESAIDYSVQSELVPKMTATLNLQSMHHVMPSVCGCHFHKLYPEYKDICERHGVRLNTSKNISTAWRSCIKRVFQLSSPELTPAWAVDDSPAAGLRGAAAAIAEHAPLIAYFATPGLALLACSPLF